MSKALKSLIIGTGLSLVTNGCTPAFSKSDNTKIQRPYAAGGKDYGIEISVR